MFGKVVYCAAAVTVGAPNEVSYKNASPIGAAERDRALRLDEAVWPCADHPAEGWERHDGLLRRIIEADEEEIPVAVEESVLRFPSAPLHGMQRLHEHHVRLPESENFHTYRVLRSVVAEGAERPPVQRIFLMHVGLNERDTMGLYYQIASRLMLDEPATVCIVRPFPGHMTRFPFHAFSETPLDRYLWDGSHLFRQFLRYMIETQWFLSVLVRRSSYRCASGANLLAESDDQATSRLDDACLAEAMELAWHLLHRASKAMLEKAHEAQPTAPRRKLTIPDRELFESSVTSLRSLLRLAEDYPEQGGDLTDADAGEPALHVLGYSLGGFTAQSVFMSWPFLISSCVTLLAGGALRDLAPTAFADPEEWQTVLHSLRYELDDRMMSRTLGMPEEELSNGAAANSNGATAVGELVAGMDLELFTYFKRTFYEVFQQDYRGSFRTRLEAFRQRMLFVVGGNDPVVRPSTVLKSSPPGGINLLEIGGLGHFIGGRTKDEEENQQRSFWLPEIAALIHRFADKAAGKQATMRRLMWFDGNLHRPLLPKAEWDLELKDLELSGARPAGKKTKPPAPKPQRLSALELLEIGSDGALPGALFERCLDDLLARMIEAGPNNGMLFILRNEVPTMLLGDAVIRERAAALYHDDLRIVRFCHGASLRQQVVRDRIGSVCLTLPWNAKSIMLGMDAQPGYPSQSESAGGQVGERLPPLDLWRESAKRCKSLSASGPQSVRIFDGNAPLEGDRQARLSDKLLAAAKRYTEPEPLTRVAALPDCWVWVSRKFLYTTAKKLSVEAAISDLMRVVPDHCASNEDVGDFLRNGDVRIVTVSRARYNPRFRGRLLVTAHAARKLLIHLALCVALSDPIDPDDQDAGFR